MLAAFIIVFREVIEAGLIIGIALAASHSVLGSTRNILLGVAIGIAGSCVVAAFTSTIASAFQGMGQELFNSAILFAAVVMLIWHNMWMSQHGREMVSKLKSAGQEVIIGSRSLMTLTVVVGVAVLREGSEVALFLYGIAVSSDQTSYLLLAGGLSGLAIGGLFSTLTYFGLLKIPSRNLFAVTSAMITFLAAGMAAQGISFLEKAGVSSLLDQTAWNTSRVLSDKAILGRLLHALIGYNDRPSVLQVLVYVSVLALMSSLTMIPKNIHKLADKKA